MFDRYLMKAKPRPLDSIGSYDKWHVTVNDKEYFIGQLAEMEGAALKTTVKENNFITGNTKESLCGGSYICTLLV